VPADERAAINGCYPGRISDKPDERETVVPGATGVPRVTGVPGARRAQADGSARDDTAGINTVRENPSRMRNQLRPVLAAALALLLPGLGHLSLRRWGRALLWHLTIVGGGVALFALYDVEPIDPLADLAAASAAIPTDVALPVVLLFALSAVDAYLVGRADVAERERADAVAEAMRRRVASADGNDAPDGGQVPPSAAVTGGDGETLKVTCPNCGKETDADIDFCHWCTEPLPWAESE